VEPTTFNPLNSKRFNRPTAPFSPGPAPFLEWIAVERLVVDTEMRMSASEGKRISETYAATSAPDPQQALAAVTFALAELRLNL
jgi:hypothetical protein